MSRRWPLFNTTKVWVEKKKRDTSTLGARRSHEDLRVRFLGGSSSRDLVPDAGARMVFFGYGSLGNTAGWALAAGSPQWGV